MRPTPRCGLLRAHLPPCTGVQLFAAAAAVAGTVRAPLPGGTGWDGHALSLTSPASHRALRSPRSQSCAIPTAPTADSPLRPAFYARALLPSPAVTHTHPDPRSAVLLGGIVSAAAAVIVRLPVPPSGFVVVASEEDGDPEAG